MFGALATVGAGCTEGDARRIIEPAPGLGKTELGLTGPDEHLIANGQISRHDKITSDDGVDLDTWTIHARGITPPAAPKGTVILLHPLLMSKSWFLQLGQRLSGDGWDVVLPDSRGHGHSGGQFITWGAKEKWDVKKIMDVLQQDGAVHEPYYVFGASMGGCIAVQYAAIDPRCKGVLALAAPAGVREVATMMMPFALPGQQEAAVRRSAEIGDFTPQDASAVEAARKLTVPLILAHGYLDLVVPYQQSMDILKAAAGPKELVPFPFNGHLGIQISHYDWIVAQIDRLAEMSRQRPGSPGL